MRIVAAPLQGFTEAPWRKYHAEVYGSGVDVYCAPFVRVERGEIRRRDLRDAVADSAVSQVICRDAEEFRLLADTLTAAGISRIDLNLGCPFPPQVKHGRGAGLAAQRDALASVLDAMKEYPQVEFSAKMRLDRWEENIPLIEDSPIASLTVHARYASQQYSGETDVDEFARLMMATRLPLTYNGNITSPEDFQRIANRFPSLDGIMIGRGLLARPSLAEEIRTGREWLPEERLEAILRLHGKLYTHYSETLCGPAQILAKIKPFWEYLEPEIGHKAAKQIRKATTTAAYLGAIPQ